MVKMIFSKTIVTLIKKNSNQVYDTEKVHNRVKTDNHTALNYNLLTISFKKKKFLVFTNHLSKLSNNN